MTSQLILKVLIYFTDIDLGRAHFYEFGRVPILALFEVVDSKLITKRTFDIHFYENKYLCQIISRTVEDSSDLIFVRKSASKTYAWIFVI